MRKLIAYPIRGILFLLIIFSVLIIIEMYNLKEVSALIPIGKIPIDIPDRSKSWDLDQTKVKNFIAENPSFSNTKLIELVGNASNRKWAVDSRYSYLEFIYNGKGLIMIYDASKNDELI